VSPNEQNWGEALFRRYLAAWGYRDVEYEPEWLNPPKKPDFLIKTAWGEVVVEVETFETWGLLTGLRDGMFAMQTLTKTLRPIRRAISHAAEQLKGIEDRPLVVVLANPDNRVPLSSRFVMAAMYGDPEYVFPADRTQPSFWQAGRNGRLYLVNERGIAHGNHAYVSAVAVLRETTMSSRPSGTMVGLDMFETASDRCVPLPLPLFSHDGDTRWGLLNPGKYGLRKPDEA
jgi:hypothetical protein